MLFVCSNTQLDAVKQEKLTHAELEKMALVFDVECGNHRAAALEGVIVERLQQEPWNVPAGGADIVLSMLVAHCVHLLVADLHGNHRILDIPTLRSIVLRFKDAAGIPAPWASLHDRLSRAFAISPPAVAGAVETKSSAVSPEEESFWLSIANKLAILIALPANAMDSGMRDALQSISDQLEKAKTLTVLQVETVHKCWVRAQAEGAIQVGLW